VHWQWQRPPNLELFPLGSIEDSHAEHIAAFVEVKNQIQKVSAQLEASKPAPQVVNNP
jgi:hypothetical protein